MKICVVVPVSASLAKARERLDCYAEYSRSDTTIKVKCLSDRVPNMADPIDDFLVPEILDAALEAEADGAEAIIIDCMDDPAVDGARRLVDIPVVGPGHASMSLAAMLGHKFSILYPMKKWMIFYRIMIET